MHKRNYVFSRFNFLLYISVLKYYSLRLLQNCKSFQLKSRFCGNFFNILRYSPHKAEFDNFGPIIRARYVVNLLFERKIGCSL